MHRRIELMVATFIALQYKMYKSPRRMSPWYGNHNDATTCMMLRL